MARVQLIFSIGIILIITLSITTSSSNAFPASDTKTSVASSGSKLQWRNGVDKEAADIGFVSEEQGIEHSDRDQQANANIRSENSQTLLRVKRNRPKFRYNRNKDVVRDY